MRDDFPIDANDDYKQTVFRELTINLREYFPKPEIYDEPEIEAIEDGD